MLFSLVAGFGESAESQSSSSELDCAKALVESAKIMDASMQDFFKGMTEL